MTVWIARKQLRFEQGKESAYGININLTWAEQLSVNVSHTGITPLYRVEVWATANGVQRQLHTVPKFEPGAVLTTFFASATVSEVFVSWNAPHPTGAGLRTEAVRVRYPEGAEKRVEYWKYYLWTRIRLAIRYRLGKKWSNQLAQKQTRFPLGRWKPHQMKISRPGDLTGWPVEYRE
ncbi:hypothetical protein [Corynebacterium glutamicum]|uniref:hypothetical protein n=1 Tax=Corynebacterium glutamicum TaxID=1718 RepID=UPI001B8C2839|nr:hypothetical protein [Corynebacterium glutamicum]